MKNDILAANLNDAEVGDVLLKIRGKTYLVSAEALGAPLEDGAMLDMLQEDVDAVKNGETASAVEFAIEIGGPANDARFARQLTRSARQLTRSARQLTRSARQLTRAN